MIRFVAVASVGVGLLVAAPTSPVEAQSQCGPWQFPDYHMQGNFEFPSTFTGQPFELSQSYPTQEPPYATDEYGWHATEDVVHVHDLHATILHLLGFDHEKLTYHYSGRDFRLTDVHGNVVHDIVA